MDILRLALLSLAAGIAIVLGASLLFQGGRQAKETVREAQPPPVASAASQQTAGASETSAQPLAAARVQIETEIATRSPDYLRFFSRLKQRMPQQYAAILDGFARQAVDGVDMGNVDTLLSEAVHSLRVSDGVLAAKADGPALGRIFAMQLAMMRALAAKNPKLCVEFLYGGASQAFYEFSAQNRGIVADMAIAGLDAIDDGRVKRIERPPPSDADFGQLERALKGKGLSDAEIAAILDGKTPDPPIADDRMCQVGQIYLETLAALPEPARLRIYGLAVELMAKS